jgi:prenyltransferase beta subunit
MSHYATQPRSLAASALLVSLLLLLLLLLLSATPGAAEGLGRSVDPNDAPNAADVVVDFGDGHTVTRRITFTDAAISGLQALQLSGLELTTVDFSFGTAVCAIEGVGCPATNCFCDANKFWGYQFWDGAAWQGYMSGASSSSVGAGAVEGWAWGPSGSNPPPITLSILSADAALQWMRPQQNANGSFGNNTGATVDVILAVAAANQRPDAWRATAEGPSLVDYAATTAASFAGQSAAAAGKLAVGAAAAGQDPRSFGGVNLVAAINSTFNAGSGAYGANNMDQAWALLGLRAAGEAVPAAAVARLASRANANGGWGWATGVASDVDSSALAIEALLAAGASPSATAVVNGLSYLRNVQLTNSDGGFAASPEQTWGIDSNTNSTAFAVQGVLAAGQDPLSATWSISATTPVDFLLGQQLPNGAFVYVDPPANLFATQQAVPALVGKPFPYLSPAVALRSGLGWVAGQQQANGSFAGFNPGATIDAVLAIALAGQNPNHFVVGSNTPMTYLGDQAPAYAAQGASAAGKMAVGAVAGRANPRSFGGVDLVAAIEGFYQPASGQYGSGSVWDQSFALLGLTAARQPLPAAAVQRLLNIAADGGGWGFSANASSADVDSTGLALQALAATRISLDNAAVQAGLTFLRSVQNEDGGFPGFTGDTDPASTGLALQGLAAYGQDPRSLGWTTWIDDGSASALTLHTPSEALLAMQSPAGGFPGFSGPNDPFSTYQALAGLTGRPLPIRQPQIWIFPLALRR